jgi:hypothetical protein
MTPAPNICPKLVTANTAGNPKPPKNGVPGNCGSELGCWILILPMTIATILQIIIVMATLRFQGMVVGIVAANKEVRYSTNFSPKIIDDVFKVLILSVEGKKTTILLQYFAIS